MENHKEEVPFAHYAQRLLTLEPENAVSRLGEIYRDGEFTLTLLGRAFAIRHPDYGIRALDGGELPAKPTQTFLLRYLLEGQKAPWLGTWKTFREMPWGELYIQPYTGRVLTRAAYSFATRISAFCRAAEELGGQKAGHGDAGYQFELLPGYFMQILVWAPDDEFPPNAQVLYSDNFVSFAAEDRVVAGDILISALKSRM